MKRHATLLTISAVFAYAGPGCHAPANAAQRAAGGQSQAAEVNDVKLSKYDRDVASAQIAVGPNGTLYAAFVEATRPALEDYVFARSSSDNGKTWTPAQNLSEEMPNYLVGPVRLTVDGQGRVYAVWRVMGMPNVALDGAQNSTNLAANLVYRVLNGGSWSPIATINQPTADQQHQDMGAGSFFVGADPQGRVHVAYSLNTDIFHPEYKLYGMYAAGMGSGSIAQVDLNGAQHTAPREVFLSPLTQGQLGKRCDTLDLLSGYFDQNGSPHFVAQATAAGDGSNQSRIVLVENGRQTPAVTLPSPQYLQYSLPPYLCVDAQGRNHVIVNYAGGEQHGIRDFLVGSGTSTLLRAEKPVNSPIRGFQANQGPAGTIAVTMEMDDTGMPDQGEMWVAVYDGKSWQPAVQLTNYHDLSSGSYKALARHASVATVGHWAVGATAAATFDRQGRLVVVHEGDQFGAFGVQGRGVTLVSGDSKSPKILFHRF